MIAGSGRDSPKDEIVMQLLVAVLDTKVKRIQVLVAVLLLVVALKVSILCAWRAKSPV